MPDFVQLTVESADQVLVQGHLGDGGDTHAHGREQEYLPDQQPCPQRPASGTARSWV